MRFAIYIRSIESARGAEERVTANIARGLAGLGHRVDILVENERGCLIDD
ncbi:MAG: hypothetical protein WBO34_10725 [Gammaproteobacteria bacterium]